MPINIIYRYELESTNLFPYTSCDWQTAVWGTSYGEQITISCFLIISLKAYAPFSIIKPTSFTLFESVASYGLSWYGSSKNIRKILWLQTRMIWVTLGSNKLAECKPLFIELKFLTTVNLNLVHLLLYNFKNICKYNEINDKTRIYEIVIHLMLVWNIPDWAMIIWALQFLTSVFCAWRFLNSMC